MGLSQLLNTVQQIYDAEHVNVIRGLFRHFVWHLRRISRCFPVHLRLSDSCLYVERPGGVSALINSLGVYDYNNMNLVKLLSGSEEAVFFDVGANIGSYTLIASESRGEVVSFEPHPEACAQLKRNITLNRRSNVEVINAAVSDHNGLVRLTDGSELSTNKVLPDSEDGTIEVECITLDEACRRLSLSPTLVKIDVEGHEDKVLKGFSDGIRTVDVLVIEGGERREIRDSAVLAGFQGPWYTDFDARCFRRKAKRRREDPVFIRTDAIKKLAELAFSFQPA